VPARSLGKGFVWLRRNCRGGGGARARSRRAGSASERAAAPVPNRSWPRTCSASRVGGWLRIGAPLTAVAGTRARARQVAMRWARGRDAADLTPPAPGTGDADARPAIQYLPTRDRRDPYRRTQPGAVASPGPATARARAGAAADIHPNAFLDVPSRRVWRTGVSPIPSSPARLQGLILPRRPEEGWCADALWAGRPLTIAKRPHDGAVRWLSSAKFADASNVGSMSGPGLRTRTPAASTHRYDRPV